MINFINATKIKTKDEVNKIYLKSLEKAHKSEEYKQNEMQILSIKKALVEHADVPEALLNMLIEATEKNTQLEYKFYTEYLFNRL